MSCNTEQDDAGVEPTVHEQYYFDKLPSLRKWVAEKAEEPVRNVVTVLSAKASRNAGMIGWCTVCEVICDRHSEEES